MSVKFSLNDAWRQKIETDVEWMKKRPVNGLSMGTCLKSIFTPLLQTQRTEFDIKVCVSINCTIIVSNRGIHFW
jgi:hypothetical protein